MQIMDSFLLVSGSGMIHRCALICCTLLSLHFSLSLPTNRIVGIRNNNCWNMISHRSSRLSVAPSDDDDAKRIDLGKKIREMEEQQQKIAEMMELLASRESRQQPSEPKYLQEESRIKSQRSGMDIQMSSAPLKVMIFVDGTWLYYSLHEAQSPVHQRYGSGWQYKYKFDWGSLPRVICKALQEQDTSLGWSTMAQEGERLARPIEAVRVMVYTSYKADTPKHSFRYQMFQEMMRAKYDVHMMETVGRVEKCIDIQLAGEPHSS